ncbi:MAG: FKBP-type peptidyl-prolyl cis-trans isomerase [Deltaproteobacteria bacterium]|nr:FKBP-type peptidyl-prolyl cis-trans isomerase [Deltaproteobacteria bacterium]
MSKRGLLFFLVTSILIYACKPSPPPSQKSGEEVRTESNRSAVQQERAASKPEPARSGLAAPPDVAAPPADATKTASGLASKLLQKGTGATHPTASDTVEVHYTGWTTDGQMFDSSVTRGRSATFPLNRVIAGWTEGVQLMVTGEKRRFWIPEALAYQGRPGAPRGMLVFDVELIGIE